MPRSVNHVASKARRTRILKLTKGYYGARKNVWTVAKNTWEKGLTYAYRDRRNKKRNFRSLWIQRINAAARLENMSYSTLMGALHKAGIEINRSKQSGSVQGYCRQSEIKTHSLSLDIEESHVQPHAVALLFCRAAVACRMVMTSAPVSAEAVSVLC